MMISPGLGGHVTYMVGAPHQQTNTRACGQSSQEPEMGTSRPARLASSQATNLEPSRPHRLAPVQAAKSVQFSKIKIAE